MCTVSVIPMVDGTLPGSGFRIVCNRDERHDRPDATSPRWRDVRGGARAIWPTDGQAGGTWIAATDRGVVLSLLNLNPSVPDPLPGPERLVSRGRVIPELLGHGAAGATLEGVLRQVEALELELHAPFRLIVAEPDARDAAGYALAEVAWDRAELVVRRHAGGPRCFASSGLGDALAAPRLDLFRDMVVGAGCTARAQDLFHAHRWPDRPEVSVMMWRAEARTVSTTHVEVLGGERAHVRMWYRPIVDASDAAHGLGHGLGHATGMTGMRRG